MNRLMLVRFSLIAILSFFGLLFFIESGHSQPGRPPGFPPAPTMPRPPGFPGRPSGIPEPPRPGFPPGMPGGGAGEPGFPGRTPGFPSNPAIPPTPNIPSPPDFPRRPGGLPDHSGNFPSAPAPAVPPPMAPAPDNPFGMQNVYETVWTCEKCGKEVGRGEKRPSISQCPHCKVKITNLPSWVQYTIVAVVLLISSCVGLFRLLNKEDDRPRRRPVKRRRPRPRYEDDDDEPIRRRRRPRDEDDD